MEGSRGLVDRAHKKLSKLLRSVNIYGRLRNKPIDRQMLEAIEMYLHYYRKKKPDVFIFGHTHKAAHTTTASRKRTRKRLIKKVIDVWNDGSFIEGRKGKAGTFIVTDDNQNPDAQVKLYEVNTKGGVREVSM